MSKKFEERNTTLTKQFNNFQKNQTQQPHRDSFSQNRGQNSNSSRANIRGNFRRIQRTLTKLSMTSMAESTKIHINHDNSHLKIFSSKIQILFFRRYFSVSNLRIQTFKIETSKIKTHSLRIQVFNRNHRLKSVLQILITRLIHNKLRSPVINVAILIT